MTFHAQKLSILVFSPLKQGKHPKSKKIHKSQSIRARNKKLFSNQLLYMVTFRNSKQINDRKAIADVIPGLEG